MTILKKSYCIRPILRIGKNQLNHINPCLSITYGVPKRPGCQNPIKLCLTDYYNLIFSDKINNLVKQIIFTDAQVGSPEGPVINKYITKKSRNTYFGGSINWQPIPLFSFC